MNREAAVFERNRSALAANGAAGLAERLAAQPLSARCEVKPARNGLLTLTVDGVAVHSAYDPVREAAGMARKLTQDLQPGTPLILVGLGLGYLAETIVSAGKHSHVVVIEPDMDILAAALRSRPLHSMLSQIHLLAGEFNESDLTQALGGPENLKTARMIALPAVRNYAPEVLSRLESMLRGAKKPHRSSLRILVVGPLYGGSHPIAGYVTRALQDLGHRAEWMDNAPFHAAYKHIEGATRDPRHQEGLLGQYSHIMAQAVLAKALDMQAQLVFFMAQSPASVEMLEELRRGGIPTSLWFVEDGQLFEYGLKMAPYYDVFFHIQKGPFEQRLRQAGAKQVHYLPLAADPEIHRPLGMTMDERIRFGSDVSHIGAGYYNRRRFFLGLLDYDFKLWGNDWEEPGSLSDVLQDEGARVSTEDAVRIFNASRVNLNLHSSTYTEGVNPHGDYINPRTFEIAAAGGFQLVDERSLLGELFEPGKEVATFHDLQSCREAIDYYLANPEEAARIAAAGRDRALTQHTYRHRMEEALDVILSSCDVPDAEGSGNTVADLVDEAGEDTELAAFFAGMGEPGDELTLEGIATKIRHEEGDLTETQAVFLLMNEFNRFAKEKGLA